MPCCVKDDIRVGSFDRLERIFVFSILLCTLRYVRHDVWFFAQILHKKNTSLKNNVAEKKTVIRLTRKIWITIPRGMSLFHWQIVAHRLNFSLKKKKNHVRRYFMTVRRHDVKLSCTGEPRNAGISFKSRMSTRTRTAATSVYSWSWNGESWCILSQVTSKRG